jgi:alkylation response protein AidB-like acyl-CoA dehydrogenase
MQSAISVKTRNANRQRVEGDFLLASSAPEEVFTREDLTDEQRMVGDTAREFFEREIAPCSKELEEYNPQLIRRLMRRAGEIGFLATEIPESDGGLGLGIFPALLQVEQFARHMSFGMAIVTHTGIGSLPIVFFGDERQKRRYLPGIMSGETVSAFALTESHSGSDALSSRVTATLDDSGRHYLLNGEKMWVTNGGIADLFIVFAKVDGLHFTAFLVERGWPGVNLGAEESKMGMRGSSSRPLLLDNVAVPVENVLGEVGAGHKVAFGTLNVCRTKLGAGLVGASKEILALSTAYSQERKAFGKRIGEFELIREKLARMAARIYAAESVVYRTAGLLAENLTRHSANGSDGIGFAAESSIVKVFTSETLDFVADEGVQIHGSNGYSSAYAVERFYRDARINRIFEGTNEIHRLLIPERLLKLVQSGDLPLQKAVADAQSAIRADRRLRDSQIDPLAVERQFCERSRAFALTLLGAAVESFGKEIRSQQMLLASISDIAIETFAIDSVLLRTRKAMERRSRTDGASSDKARISAAKLFAQEAFDRARMAALNATGIIASADSNPVLETAVYRLTTTPLADCAKLCNSISAEVIASGGYPFLNYSGMHLDEKVDCSRRETFSLILDALIAKPEIR